MGYLYDLWVIEKEKFNEIKNMTSEELWKFVEDKPTDDDMSYPPYEADVFKKAGGEEIFGLGKDYEAFELIREHLKPAFTDKNVDYHYNIDTDVLIADPIILNIIIDLYKVRIKNWYEEMSSENMSKERLLLDMKQAISWIQYIDDSDSKWSLGTSWRYEHEIFSLIHIKKIFDPEKHIIILTGG